MTPNQSRGSGRFHRRPRARRAQSCCSTLVEPERTCTRIMTNSSTAYGGTATPDAFD
jgi:hypothetical protein